MLTLTHPVTDFDAYLTEFESDLPTLYSPLSVKAHADLWAYIAVVDWCAERDATPERMLPIYQPVLRAALIARAWAEIERRDAEYRAAWIAENEPRRAEYETYANAN